jgi:hypothetical protein
MALCVALAYAAFKNSQKPHHSAWRAKPSRHSSLFYKSTESYTKRSRKDNSFFYKKIIEYANLASLDRKTMQNYTEMSS